MTTTDTEKLLAEHGLTPLNMHDGEAADPRQKLIALIQWAASPDCPLEMPAMLQAMVPIWLPLWLGKIQNMQPADLDRAAGHVLELATRVRDPNISVDEFKAWLPRA